jgi:hypothetical protein
VTLHWKRDPPQADAAHEQSRAAAPQGLAMQVGDVTAPPDLTRQTSPPVHVVEPHATGGGLGHAWSTDHVPPGNVPSGKQPKLTISLEPGHVMLHM